MWHMLTQTGWSAVDKCLQHWPVGQQTSSCRFRALDPCVDPSPAFTPVPCFQACKMEQGSCGSSWCQCSLHTSFSYASSIPALDAQGRDPAKCLTHALHLSTQRSHWSVLLLFPKAFLDCGLGPICLECGGT